MGNKLKTVFFLILIIVILVAGVSVYFLFFNKDNKIVENEKPENISQSENLEEKENKEENEAKNETTIENTVSNSNNEVTKVNISNNETNATEPETTENNYDVNVDELKKFLETYSVGIQRLAYAGENLESNTILLFLAKQYFDTNSTKKSSLKVDTKYATTVSNIHKYLTELTGTNYNNIEYVNSYKNYIGYSPSNKSYIYGSDISILKAEEYECPKLELTDEEDGIYTAKGQVIRIVNNEETVYDISLKFQINPNYTYQKYQIISLKTANKSFYPDNTIHLIENSEAE